MAVHVFKISVPNPDFPFEPPIYEGDSDSAHDKIVPGTYEAWDMDTERDGKLIVTDRGSWFELGYRDPGF
jgi:hypothetical protein